jgi:hypothetical protein
MGPNNRKELSERKHSPTVFSGMDFSYPLPRYIRSIGSPQHMMSQVSTHPHTLSTETARPQTEHSYPAPASIFFFSSGRSFSTSDSFHLLGDGVFFGVAFVIAIFSSQG